MSTILAEPRPVTDKEALRIIGENVRRLRGNRTMVWLANEVGTYATNISRIENAEDMPGAGLLLRVAKALDVSVDELFSQPPNNNRKRD